MKVLETRARLHLVLQLARGGELHTRITETGRLSEPRARNVFVQVRVIQTCHFGISTSHTRTGHNKSDRLWDWLLRCAGPCATCTSWD